MFILNGLPIGVKVAPRLNESQPELKNLPQESHEINGILGNRSSHCFKQILHKIKAGTTHISKVYVQRTVLKGVFEKVVELLLKDSDHYGPAIQVKKKTRVLNMHLSLVFYNIHRYCTVSSLL